MRHRSRRRNKSITRCLLCRGQSAAGRAQREIVEVDEIRSVAEDSHVERIGRLDRWTKPKPLSKFELTGHVQIELPQSRPFTSVSRKRSRAAERCERKLRRQLCRECRAINTPRNIAHVTGKVRTVVAQIVEVAVDAAG